MERGATIVEDEEEEAIDGRFPEEVLLFIIILSNDCFKFKLQLISLKLSRYGNKGKEVSRGKFLISKTERQGNEGRESLLPRHHPFKLGQSQIKSVFKDG